MPRELRKPWAHDVLVQVCGCDPQRFFHRPTASSPRASELCRILQAKKVAPTIVVNRDHK